MGFQKISTQAVRASSSSEALAHLAEHEDEVLEEQGVDPLNPLHNHHQRLLGSILLLLSFFL
jgi:hypothetical protein